MKKQLEYYLGLNYPIEITGIPEKQGGGILACIPMLGRYAFRGDGETIEEAITALDEIKSFLFSDYLKRSIRIPEPEIATDKEYSGRFVLRMPKELHKYLAEEARKNATTLNQYCTFLLTRKSYLKSIQDEVLQIHQEVTDVFDHIKEVKYSLHQSLSHDKIDCSNNVSMFEYAQCG